MSIKPDAWISSGSSIVRWSHVIAVLNPKDGEYFVVDPAGKEHPVDKLTWAWIMSSLNRSQLIGPPQKEESSTKVPRNTLQEMAAQQKTQAAK